MRTRRSQSSSDPVPPTQHRSVLLHEAIDALDIHSSDIIVDATLGGAGHALEIAKRLGGDGMFIGFDLDSNAIERATSTLSDVELRTILIQANFRTMKDELGKRDINHLDKALFDLGWSSDQLQSGRGFSFLCDEPLLMTYSTGPDGLTARTIVNEWSESSLADVIFGWGEERYGRRIAKAIVEARMREPIETSKQLGTIVAQATPPAYRHGRIHPATKTFQALRIAVNDELGALDEGLRSAWEMLSEGGRIAVITFHSIEDRAVKRFFADLATAGAGVRLTKKPIIPGAVELSDNPRARSAKLRVIEKKILNL